MNNKYCKISTQNTLSTLEKTVSLNPNPAVDVLTIPKYGETSAIRIEIHEMGM